MKQTCYFFFQGLSIKKDLETFLSVLSTKDNRDKDFWRKRANRSNGIFSFLPRSIRGVDEPPTDLHGPVQQNFFTAELYTAMERVGTFIPIRHFTPSLIFSSKTRNTC